MIVAKSIAYSKVVEGPEVEPVQLDDLAKLDLKVEGTDEDDLIQILIQAAREVVERITGRSLITQTRQIKLDYFPCGGCIHLTNGPIQEDGIEISYFDSNGNEQVLDSADYWIDAHADIARIVIKESWPTTQARPNAATIEYLAGYGDTPETVPAAIRKAMLLLIAHMYENRQQVTALNLNELPFGVEALLSTYIITQNVSY